MTDDNFSLDEALDETFSIENDGDDNEASTETETQEKDNDSPSLEEIINDNEENKTKETTKIDTEINNNKQITKQQPNKSRGNNNSTDLVDENGKIIAKAGAERRFYEENVKLKKEKADFHQRVLPTLRNNYNAMVEKLNAYETSMQAMHAEDLTPDDITTGMELIRQWKQSPENTIKFLLTQAKSYGINIDSNSTGIDTAAINQMLDEKLKPFIQEREEAQRLQEVSINARNIYNDFMSRFPDAKNHTNELAYLYRKNPNASLPELYYMLKNHYSENGYDFNTPLEEILNQQNQTKQMNNNSVNNFGSIGINQTAKMQSLKTPVASINKSYDTIIKEVLGSYKK